MKQIMRIIFGMALGVVCLIGSLGIAAAAEGEWLTNLDQALAKAKVEGKFVLVDFGGSDWCPPCKRLKAEIFSRPEFKAFASTNLILVDIDFPQETPQSPELKKANEKLGDKYQIEMYPTVVLLNEKGKKIFREDGYPGTTVEKYIATLQRKMKKR